MENETDDLLIIEINDKLQEMGDPLMDEFLLIKEIKDEDENEEKDSEKKKHNGISTKATYLLNENC